MNKHQAILAQVRNDGRTQFIPMLPRVAVFETRPVIGKLECFTPFHRLSAMLPLQEPGEVPQIAVTVGAGTVRREFGGEVDLQSSIKIPPPVFRDVCLAALHVVIGLFLATTNANWRQRPTQWFILLYTHMNIEIPNLTAFDEAALESAFAQLERQARAAAAALDGEAAVDGFKLQWLGRKQGLLKEVSDRWLKAAPVEAKKLLGVRFNALKAVVEALLDEALGAGPTDAALAREAIDITLPGTRRLSGAEHLITRTTNEIVSVFAALGYSVGVGPEVETDYYNFESMNFPPGHPARDTQDTLVVAGQERRPQRDRLLLRTHTSPVQMRTMESQPPPVRIVIPGKVHQK